MGQLFALLLLLLLLLLLPDPQLRLDPHLWLDSPPPSQMRLAWNDLACRGYRYTI
eukprot:COSAG02_NODE_14335_length_1283_cov_1.298986_1_plen_55_part_00